MPPSEPMRVHTGSSNEYPHTIEKPAGYQRTAKNETAAAPTRPISVNTLETRQGIFQAASTTSSSTTDPVVLPIVVELAGQEYEDIVVRVIGGKVILLMYEEDVKLFDDIVTWKEAREGVARKEEALQHYGMSLIGSGTLRKCPFNALYQPIVRTPMH